MKKSVDILLKLDLLSAANSLGFHAGATDDLITENNLYDIINDIELALLEGENEKSIANVCGLLWTHFGEKFDLLAEYVHKTMTTIGFAPVWKMLATTSDATTARVSSSSLFSMLESTLQAQKESVKVDGREYLLTRFQKRLWTQLTTERHVAISAPTSAGKSFLLCLYIIGSINSESGTSIYIVPTLTLMSQVVNDLVELARTHSKTVKVSTHIERTESAIPTIYVLTQERLADHGALLAEDICLDFLVIDEVQNIERAFELNNGDSRAKLLLDVIVNLHDKYTPETTIISGPRIADISLLGQTIFEKKCTPVTTINSPVTNICYSIEPGVKSESVIIRQFSELDTEHRYVEVLNIVGATGFGGSLYNQSYYAYLKNVTKNNPSTLIFSPTSSQARKTALELSKNSSVVVDEKLDSLAGYIEETVSKHYDLASCVRNGVAFHHGKMPHHVRNAVELAVTQGKMQFVVCTTTLMQGVNIPARNVVMRNPNLFVKKTGGGAPKLSAYEIANLRGRAGRLLRDFVGRTYILDGTSFEESEEQLSLFEPTSKRIEGSYDVVFRKHKEQILESLVTETQNGERTSLAKYISNVLYTEPHGAALLARKGIHLDKDEFYAIKRSQLSLTVDRKICRTHRYWDPFDLQTIHDNIELLQAPASPFTVGSVDKLNSTLSLMSKILPNVSSNYLGKRTANNENKIWVLAKSALQWANETPLAKLLDNDYARGNSDQTDAAISMLQNTVAYGIPALLSPVYAMKRPESITLGAIERGAVQPATILQINNNIPRETAVHTTRRAKEERVTLATMHDVLNFIRNYPPNYWDLIQYRHLLNLN